MKKAIKIKLRSCFGYAVKFPEFGEIAMVSTPRDLALVNLFWLILMAGEERINDETRQEIRY